MAEHVSEMPVLQKWIMTGETAKGEVSPEILASWQRCRANGLDSDDRPRKVVLSQEELARRRAENDHLIQAARGILIKLREAVPGGSVEFSLSDAEGYRIDALVLPGEEKSRDQATLRCALGENCAEAVMGTNATGLVLSADRPFFLKGSEHYYVALQGRNGCAAPIRDTGQRTIAILTAEGADAEVSPQTCGMIVAVAKAVEREVELRKVTDRLAEQNRQLTLLNEVALLLNSSEWPESALAEAADRIKDLSRLGRVTLYRMDEESGELVGLCSTEVSPTVAQQMRVRLDEPTSALSQAVRERRPVMYTGLQGPSMISRIDGVRLYAALGFPILIQQRVVGAIFAADPKPHAFSADEILAFHAVANQLGVALERSRLHRSLTEEGLKQQAILEHVDVGIVIIDVQHGSFIWNNRMREFFRLQDASRQRCDSKGFCPEYYMRWPVRFSVDPESGMRRVIANGETIIDEAVVLSDFPQTMRVTTGPVRDETGAVRWVVRSYIDVTRYRELERVKSELIAMISHELRTPITAIKGYARLLTHLHAADSPEERHILGGLCQETEELAGLVERVLAVSRLDRGMDRRSLREISLSELLDEVVETLRLEANTKGVILVLNLPGEVTVVGDREGLKRVFINLIHNSIKYTSADRRVTVSLSFSEDEATVEVGDEGIGIAEEHLDHIFERFYRVPTPETVGLPGSGLGLYIVKGVVEQHGGRVSVQSRLGTGTTFTVVLPRREGVSNGQGKSVGGR